MNRIKLQSKECYKKWMGLWFEFYNSSRICLAQCKKAAFCACKKKKYKDRSFWVSLPFIRIIRVWGHKEIFSKVVVFIVAHTLLDWLKSPLDLRVSIIFNATFFYLSAILVNDSRGFAEITFKDLSFAAAIIIIDLFMIFWRSDCCFVYLVWI